MADASVSLPLVGLPPIKRSRRKRRRGKGKLLKEMAEKFAKENAPGLVAGHSYEHDQPGPPSKRRKTECSAGTVGHNPPQEGQAAPLSQPIPNGYTKPDLELLVTIHLNDGHPVSIQAGPISVPPQPVPPPAGPDMAAPAIITNNHSSSSLPAESGGGAIVKRRRRRRRGKKGQKNHIVADNVTMATCTCTSMFGHQTPPSLNQLNPPISLPQPPVTELCSHPECDDAISGGGVQCRARSSPSRPEINREMTHIKTEQELQTEPEPDPGPSAPHCSRVVAIDCEMVGCPPDDATISRWKAKGKKRAPIEMSKAGRCTVVNYHGNVLYDKYIRPNEEIISYRTKYSGIEETHMKNATPIDQARLEILDILRDKIVVGHDIKNDLDALSITLPPEAIRDTCFSVPLRRRAKLNRFKMASLKKLTWQIFKKAIQKGPHDSCVDARMTMSLYRCVEGEWERKMKAKCKRLV